MDTPSVDRDSSPGLSSQMGGKVIRVLLVDDSPLICEILAAMLEDVPDIRVVGQANNGQDAIRMAIRLKPDVITMDIRMPKMDGLEATRQIMNLQPTPIIVLSSAVYATDYNIAFNAIGAGALTVIEKPKGLGVQDYDIVRAEMITAIRTMSGVKVIGRRDNLTRKDGIGPMTAMLYAYFNRPIKVVAVASSTGGPPALMELFSNLPKDFSIPIIVVQHILPAFIQALVEWLGTRSTLPVSIAAEGDKLTPGKILIAPVGLHLTITPGGVVHLDTAPPIKGQRPSANRMFESIAKTIGANSIGIIMTGMGDDGVDGLEQLGKAGAHVIAQDEASCVVYGMPKEAVKRGIVDEILSPEEIVVRLTKLHSHMQSLAQS